MNAFTVEAEASVFSFESPARSASTPKRRLPLPKGITIVAGEEERPNEGYRVRASNRPLVITRRWFRPAYLVFACFAFLLDGLILVLYSEPEPYGAGALMSLVIAAVGLASTYVALALVGSAGPEPEGNPIHVLGASHLDPRFGGRPDLRLLSSR